MTKIRIPTMLLGIMFLLLACGKNVDSEIQAENISKAESEAVSQEYCIIFCWKSRTRKRQRLKNRKRNSKKILADKILKEYKKTGQDQGGIIE